MLARFGFVWYIFIFLMFAFSRYSSQPQLRVRTPSARYCTGTFLSKSTWSGKKWNGYTLSERGTETPKQVGSYLLTIQRKKPSISISSVV